MENLFSCETPGAELVTDTPLKNLIWVGITIQLLIEREGYGKYNS